jgi:hypothetical protein
MHGEVGVNVLQENDDDIAMPDIAIHDANEKLGVNTEPMATLNDVFRNTLADDTKIYIARFKFNSARVYHVIHVMWNKNSKF